MNEIPRLPPFQHLAPELRLYCGGDSISGLARELKRRGCSRAVVVSGKSVSASDAMGLLRDTLGAVLIGESQSVRPDSPVSAVEEAARALRDLQADAVVAVGGGSAAVTARAAAIVLAERRPARELCTRRLANGDFESPRLDAPKLPQFVVPTTPSTAFVKAGSAVHDDETHQRLALFDPKTRATGVFVHPDFLCTAPGSLVLGAALNTLSTAVEALESPRCDPVAEAMLRQALRLIAQHIDGFGLPGPAVREHLAVASVLCGRGTEQAGGGLASVLAHAIGHRTGASNGVVNAIVLPHTMRFNAPMARRGGGRVLEASGLQVPGAAASELDAPAQALERLLARLPVPHRLRDIGVLEMDVEPIARAAMTDWFISRSARRVESVEDVSGLLRAAW
jgi:alcohol dehydrogenase class IV